MEQQHDGPSPGVVMSGLTAGMFTWLGFWGSFGMVLEWPAAIIVGYFLVRSLRRGLPADIEYVLRGEFFLSAALGLIIGGTPMWLVFGSMFSWPYTILCVLSPGICLLAGALLAAAHNRVSHIIDQVAAAL